MNANSSVIRARDISLPFEATEEIITLTWDSSATNLSFVLFL
jgi:hypothetical protein